MSKKLTPWFPANVTPVRVGVYEIDTDEFEAPNYRTWLGSGWSGTYIGPIESSVSLYRPGQGLKAWRGLAEEACTTTTPPIGWRRLAWSLRVLRLCW